MQETTELQGNRDKLFTSNYILLCISRFAFFGSMSYLLPILPLYTIAIGGSEKDIGFVVGVFTIPIVILSPLVGRAVDEWGRKWLMVLGTVIFVLAAIFYSFATALPLLLILRVFHGTGLAAFNTSSSAYVADIAPVRRRGEAIGYFGMATNVAMAITPAIAVVVVESFGFNTLFVICAATASLAVVSTLPLVDHHKRVAGSQDQPRPALVNRIALFPSAIMVTLSISYGAIVSFLPLYAVKNDVSNPGLFFTAYAVVLLASRTVSGILSDRLGRGAVIVPGLALTGIGIWMLCFSGSLTTLMLVALVYGIGFGSVQPTLMAYTVDRAGVQGRGSAMGTLMASFDVGLGVGSMLLGFVLQYTDFPVMFFLSGLAPILGLVLFVFGSRRSNVSAGEGATLPPAH